MQITGYRTPITGIDVGFAISEGERDTLEILDTEGGAIYEIWRDEGNLMVRMVEDGLSMIGRFDARGFLIGDWIV